MEFKIPAKEKKIFYKLIKQVGLGMILMQRSISSVLTCSLSFKFQERL